ncbi:MAG: FkbM family methyltransferase [Pseudomonadota bacterium]
MLSVLKPENMLPARLRRAHLHRDAHAEGSEPWQRVAWYSSLGSVEPETAIAGLEAEFAARPSNAAALYNLLDLYITHRDPAAIDRLCGLIRADKRRPPFWVHRFVEVWQTGRISMDTVELALSRGAVQPEVLRGFAHAHYENREATIAAHLVRDGDRVLELGAGVGYVAATALQGKSRIVWRAVEAHPELIPILKETRDLNGLDFAIEHAAYCGHNGHAPLNISARGFWASSLAALDDTVRVIEVPAVCGAEALARHCPTVLIMDIEGAEYDVLRDADLHSIDRVLVEFHPSLVSDLEHTRALGRMIASGFVIDTALSDATILCFRRN